MANVLRTKQRFLLSPEKLFDLPVYAKQMAFTFTEFGTSKSKPCKHTYTLNVLQFIDGSTSKGRETFDSSINEDSTMESTPT